MSLEENKAIVRRFIEAYNNRNLDVFDDLLAPDYFDHTSKVGPEGLKQLMNMAFKAFPDFHETIEDIIAEGEKVWVRITFTGTHTGEWMGIPPTGKKVTTEMVDIFRIIDGKLVEYRDVNNNLDFLKKLGIIEYTEQGKKLFSQG
ncbi:MAG: ester cyclase [Candidatus Bathyarchaeota archaeon]|nr:ester cyclase [Candidatus Bathyarchaeota archaeon]